MKFRKFASALALALAGVTFGAAATSIVQADTISPPGNPALYRYQERSNWTAQACGYAVTGWIHEIQQYTLTPTGQLNFHYIANGQATGVDADGNRIDLKLNNKELDHILQTTVPDLDPYLPVSQGGDGRGLQGWVEDNWDVVVEINAQFNERTVKPGNGGKTLQNHWVFQVNHNGTTVDSVKFTGSCG